MNNLKLTVPQRLQKLYNQKQEIEKEISLKIIFSKDEKIEIFKSLFIARSDIYLKKWESENFTEELYYPVSKTFKCEDYISLL